MRAACVAAIFASVLLGCQSHTARQERQGGEVGHVVIFWLKQPGDEAARRRIIDASHGFRSIPGVTRVDAGAMLPSPRPNVDRTYDVAVVMWFKDRAALESYQLHPRHKAMLQEVGPLVERAVVYDFQ